MYEEVKDMLLKFERRKFEINNEMIKVNELKVDVRNLKEEVLGCKTELRKSKIKISMLVVRLYVLAFVIIYHLMFHESERNTLVFGN